MIRRLQHGAMVESITPRTVTGGRVLVAPVEIAVETSTDNIDAQAYRQGYAEGFQAGEEDGRREAEQYQQAWEQEKRQQIEGEYQSLVQEREAMSALIWALNEQLRRHEESMEHAAFELALSGLAHAFGSMQSDDELLGRLCMQMAEEYRGKAVQLTVSSIDREHLPDHIQGLEVAVEHGLSPGECRIVTTRGYAESSIAVRLDAIYRAMLQSLGVERP
jgi:flagellar biosynthesis/type III secretory pathway protein FliH